MKMKKFIISFTMSADSALMFLHRSGVYFPMEATIVAKLYFNRAEFKENSNIWKLEYVISDKPKRTVYLALLFDQEPYQWYKMNTGPDGLWEIADVY